MPSPFPGMDPYIEYQANWADFHNRLITALCEDLGVTLPDDYVARTEERIEVISDDRREGHFGPDVLVTRDPAPRRTLAHSGRSGGIATLEPTRAEIRFQDTFEERSVWLEILHLPDLELVSVVEILSPSNKQSPGRAPYLRKRQALLNRGVNLVEIDLLLGGVRPPMEPDLEAWDYVGVVARPHRLPEADVYGWSIRDPLPRLPIPLKQPDPDVLVDLAPLATHVYDRGRYRKTLRHDKPLPAAIPLHPEEHSWAEQLGRSL